MLLNYVHLSGSGIVSLDCNNYTTGYYIICHVLNIRHTNCDLPLMLIKEALAETGGNRLFFSGGVMQYFSFSDI